MKEKAKKTHNAMFTVYIVGPAYKKVNASNCGQKIYSSERAASREAKSFTFPHRVIAVSCKLEEVEPTKEATASYKKILADDRRKIRDGVLIRTRR